MDRGCERRRARAFCDVRAAMGVLAVSLGLAASGCTTTGPNPLLQSRPATVAFESIDGPPPALFRKLVAKLGEEAQARQVPMVTREGFAPYRVRGYLAAGVEKKKNRTTISWVWDVYDAEERRAFRIAGEETVNGAPGDAWALADDALLGRIAQKGMAQLAEYLRGTGAAPAQPALEPAAPDRSERVAALDDRPLPRNRAKVDAPGTLALAQERD